MHGQWGKSWDVCVSDDQCEATLTSGWEMTPTFTVRKLKLREVKSLVGGGTLALLGSRACLSVRAGGSLGMCIAEGVSHCAP